MLSFYLTLIDDEQGKALFTEFYHRYEKKLYAVAINILKNPSLAEDAVSETFFAVAKHFQKFMEIYQRNSQEIGPWAITIVKNSSLKILMKEQREGALPDIWDISALGYARPQWQKVLRAVAMILLVLGLTFALLWTNPTARAWIQRYLRIHHDEVGMDEYVFQNSEEQEISQGKIRPSYIPEGYVETDAFELSGQWYITYTDGRGGQIELAILPIKTGSFLVFDTDHSTSSAISIHGMDGQLYTALSAEWPNVLILFDETNGLCYYLESNEPAQVLIQIANSLSK